MDNTRGPGGQDRGPVGIFRNSWSIYDAIIGANLMHHREIHRVVRGIVADVRARSARYTFLDLGCGNARVLAATLRELPPTRYVGIDLSAPALDEAAVALAGLPDIVLREQDMVEAAAELGAGGQRFDVVYSGFAMHHLPADAKRRFVRSVAGLLAPGGVFLLADLVREEGESREQHAAEYTRMVRAGWDGLEPAQIEEVCAHVVAHDDPETWPGLVAMARAAGLTVHCTLAKHDRHWAMRFS